MYILLLAFRAKGYRGGDAPAFIAIIATTSTSRLLKRLYDAHRMPMTALMIIGWLVALGALLFKTRMVPPSLR